MTTWFLYILRCNDGTLYTGITTNLQRRLKEHNAGKGAKYTAGRTPVKLVYNEKHTNRSLASQREAEIKNLTRKTKLKLIQAQ